MHLWNDALELIEANLAEELDLADVARAAMTSEYHFRRMFSSLAGMPVSEYIRRRRMTVAAADVLRGEGLLDVAIRYGYGSAEAFTRAFRTVHGISPAQAREPGARLASQTRLSFHLRVEGTTPMNHRIVDLPATTLIGLRTAVPVVYSGPNQALIDFERSISTEARERLAALNDAEPRGLLSVTAGNQPDAAEGSEVDYWRAAASTQDIPDGFDELRVPAGTWAVFEAEGELPQVAQQLWADAATEWFPSNPYRWAPGPQLMSADLEPGSSHGTARLWIPVEPELAGD
ncbi:AraC family transcriptional regulator [Zhihengliuella somnathii]